MKLVMRTKERNLLRRKGEPYSRPWRQWELCEGAIGLTLSECQMLIREWTFDDRREWLNKEHTYALITGPYGQEEYQILPDNAPIPGN